MEDPSITHQGLLSPTQEESATPRTLAEELAAAEKRDSSRKKEEGALGASSSTKPPVSDGSNKPASASEAAQRLASALEATGLDPAAALEAMMELLSKAKDLPLLSSSTSDSNSTVDNEDEPVSPLAHKSSEKRNQEPSKQEAKKSAKEPASSEHEERGRRKDRGAALKTPATKHRERSRSKSPVVGTLPRKREEKKRKQREKLIEKAAAFEAAASEPTSAAPLGAQWRTDGAKRKTYAQVVSDGSDADSEGEPEKRKDAPPPPAPPPLRQGAPSDDPDDSTSSSSSSSDESGWHRDSDFSREEEGPHDRFRVVRKKTKGDPRPGSYLPIPKGSNFKPPVKLDTPKKYSGKDDRPIELERWYRSIRTLLRTAMIHEASQYATTIIISCLDSEAAYWADREIQRDLDRFLPGNGTDLRSIASPWPLSKVRDELYTRFVNPDDHIKAEEEWRLLKQRKPDGSFLIVQKLETRMREISERLVECHPMQKKRKLFDALRPEIAKELYRVREFRGWDTDDRVRMRDLVAEAINIEQSLNLLEASEQRRERDEKPQYDKLQRKPRNRSERKGDSNDSKSKRKRLDGKQRNRRTEGFDKGYEQGLAHGRLQGAEAVGAAQNIVERTVLARIREMRALFARDEGRNGIFLELSDIQVVITRPQGGVPGSDEEPGVRWLRDIDGEAEIIVSRSHAKQHRSPSAAPSDASDSAAVRRSPARERSASVAVSEVSNASTLVAATQRLGPLDEPAGAKAHA